MDSGTVESFIYSILGLCILYIIIKIVIPITMNAIDNFNAVKELIETATDGNFEKVKLLVE